VIFEQWEAAGSLFDASQQMMLYSLRVALGHDLERILEPEVVCAHLVAGISE
jgi:hypothetical protein